MKKKLFILCIIPLLLTACDFSKKNSSSDYQTNLKYGEALSEAEKATILTIASEKMKDMIHIDQTTVTSTDTVLNSGTQTVSETYDLYSNYLKHYTKTTGHVISNDVEYDIASTETTNHIWKHNIADFIRYVSYTEDKAGLITNVSITRSDTDLVANPVFNTLIVEYNTSNYLAFQVDGGYELVYSLHQRSVSYTEVGGQTRDNISESKTQYIVHFNSSCQLIWSTSVYSQVKSVDPGTGEWYGSPKEVHKVSRKIEVTYGQKQAISTNELYAVLKGKTIVWAVEPVVKTGLYKTSMADTDFTIDNNIKENTFSCDTLGTTSQTYTLTLNNTSTATSRKNALMAKANFVIYYFNGNEEGAKTFSNQEYTFSNYGSFSTSTTTSGSKYYYFSSSTTYSVYFSLVYSQNSLSAAASLYYW